MTTYNELVGQRIKQARINANLTLEELGNRVGLTKSTVTKYERGEIKTLDVSKLKDFAFVLGIDSSYLAGWDNDSNNTKEFIPSHQKIEIVTIPLYDCIACGQMTFLDDDIIDYITLPSTMVNPNKDYFSNYAKGDSMIDRGIKEGDLLVFEKTQFIGNGEVGAFCYNDEATCKVYRITDNGIILMPANINHNPIIVDSENFRIVGKLVYKICKEK